jgi:hypothetical protein
MHAKFQRSTESVDCKREALVAVGRKLSSIYDPEISRPLPDRFARLLGQIGQSGPQETTTPILNAKPHGRV